MAPALSVTTSGVSSLKKLLPNPPRYAEEGAAARVHRNASLVSGAPGKTKPPRREL